MIDLRVFQLWHGPMPTWIKTCIDSVRRVYPQAELLSFDVRDGERVRNASDRVRFDIMADATGPTLYLDTDVYLFDRIELPAESALARWRRRYVDYFAMYYNGTGDLFKEIRDRCSEYGYSMRATHRILQRYRKYPQIDVFHLSCYRNDPQRGLSWILSQSSRKFCSRH